MVYQNKIIDLERQLNRLEKEKRFFTQTHSNENDNYYKLLILSLITGNYDHERQSLILHEIFDKNKIPIISILCDRIEKLEIQNYSLISKNDLYIQMINSYIDELVEYYEVVYDIKNVLNQVYDASALTKEFLIIRETLNNKEDFLKKQKEIYIEEKNQLNSNKLKENNMDVILCKDKILEFKITKTSNILDDKINYYENISKQTSFDFELIIKENNILKTYNIKLRNLLIDILKDNIIYLDPHMIKEINQIFNSQTELILADDLFYMLNSQAQLIENILK